jgi:hypothetical protein
MNIQVVSGHCTRASFMKASFKMGKVSSDAICRAYCVGGSLGQSCNDVQSGNGHETCILCCLPLGM